MASDLNDSLPAQYWENLVRHFGEDIANRVRNAYAESPSVAIRLHPKKGGIAPVSGIRIPYTKRGYLLDERPSFAQDPHFHGGAYYVQDASSMVLEAILDAVCPNVDGAWLDVCAAPGGKSTILLDYLDGRGFLIANEVDANRNAVLRENLLKWGYINHGITSLLPSAFGTEGCKFKLVLVDAPCSGEGMFRKDAFAVEQWSENLVKQCANTQQHILTEIASCVENEGYLIYSTCTTNALENDAQVSALIDSGQFIAATPKLDAFSEFLVPAVAENKLLGYYLLPGISQGEGLFISVLQKIGNNEETPKSRNDKVTIKLKKVDSEFQRMYGDWLSEEALAWEWREEVHLVSGTHHLLWPLYFKRIGLPFYQMKGSQVIPLHGLAMHCAQSTSISLNIEDALRYLRKESIYLRSEKQVGWHLVSFEQTVLGWIKALDNRTNNYYPNGLRLRT